MIDGSKYREQCWMARDDLTGGDYFWRFSYAAPTF